MAGLRKIQIELGENQKTTLNEIIDVIDISIHLGECDEDGNKIPASQFIRVWYKKIIFDKENKVYERSEAGNYELLEKPEVRELLTPAVKNEAGEVVTPAEYGDIIHEAVVSLSEWNASPIASAIENAIKAKLNTIFGVN